MATLPTISSRLMIFLLATCLFAGCGSGVTAFTSTSSLGAALSVLPSSTSLTQGSTITLSTNNDEPSTCQWTSSNLAILSPLANGEFVGNAAGNSTVSATCGSSTATAMVVVKPITFSGPIKITSGGTYSGNWASTDPSVAAVEILTDAPVTIQNSTVTGPGNLIHITGVKTGANVTITNVTGTALDPKTYGLQRGSFVISTGLLNSISVTQCTIHGAALGVFVNGSTVSTLKIIGNKADGMEDRASDGRGGFLTSRPMLGHFIAVSRVTAPNGAEIAWNQMIDQIGSTSVEDAISLYDFAGTAKAPVVVHDNYLEGGASAAAPTLYTGAGILTDGPGNDGGPLVAYINILNNQVVHTAGGGVGITVGHDVTASGNRVVSCGKDAAGNWFAMPFTTAIAMFNYNNSPSFYNNTITASHGGLLRPSATGTPQIADGLDPLPAVMASQNNSIAGNQFTDPCLLKNGSINPVAEVAENAVWILKLLQSGVKMGDQH